MSEVGSVRLAESTGGRVRCCACQLGCWEVGGLAARKVAGCHRNRQTTKQQPCLQTCTLHFLSESTLPTRNAAFFLVGPGLFCTFCHAHAPRFDRKSSSTVISSRLITSGCSYPLSLTNQSPTPTLASIESIIPSTTLHPINIFQYGRRGNARCKRSKRQGCKDLENRSW